MQLRLALEPAARQGDAASQRALAQLLLDWDRDKPDPAAAHAWFASAAKAGDAQAQAWMGDCARQGLVGAADKDEAQRWYRLAAGQGHAGALVEYVRLQDAADSRAADTRAADAPGHEVEAGNFGLWLAAAATGDAAAQRAVGVCYLEGRGCVAHAGEAARWLRAAAAQGDAKAQFLLGCCFRYGKGVRRDAAQAKYWFERAASREKPAAAARTSEPAVAPGALAQTESA
jgi:TPR repeat protein